MSNSTGTKRLTSKQGASHTCTNYVVYISWAASTPPASVFGAVFARPQHAHPGQPARGHLGLSISIPMSGAEAARRLAHRSVRFRCGRPQTAANVGRSVLHLVECGARLHRADVRGAGVVRVLVVGRHPGGDGVRLHGADGRAQSAAAAASERQSRPAFAAEPTVCRPHLDIQVNRANSSLI